MPGLITFFSATMEPNVFVFVSILIDTEISSSLPTHIDDWVYGTACDKGTPVSSGCDFLGVNCGWHCHDGGGSLHKKSRE